MEIQGTEEQINQVILAVERGTFVRIENMDVRNIPVVEDERGFFHNRGGREMFGTRYVSVWFGRRTA